jgi:hypothetical protein
MASGTTWFLAGSDAEGTLLAVDENRSVRVVSAPPGGTAQVLLDETTYQKSWSFDPNNVVALRRSDGIDVLVSDQSFVVLVRKQGSSVRVVELATSSGSDLTALALAAGTNGTLAVFQQGKDAYGTPQKITAVDVDPLIAAAGSTPANISLVQQVSAMTQATRSFTAPAGAAAVSTGTQVWLTTERLDATADCQSTGQTSTCSGGNPAVPWLNCAWHVDAFKLQSGADLQKAAAATADSHAWVHAACGSATPVNPGSINMSWPFGLGLGGHHASAVDPSTSQLALALAYQAASTDIGVQFTLVDPSGTSLISGVNETVSLGDLTANPWIAARGGHVFYCGSLNPAICWSVAASGATTLAIDDDESISGAVQTTTGLGLVQQMSSGDASAWLQPLDCTP